MPIPSTKLLNVVVRPIRNAMYDAVALDDDIALLSALCGLAQMDEAPEPLSDFPLDKIENVTRKDIMPDLYQISVKYKKHRCKRLMDNLSIDCFDIHKSVEMAMMTASYSALTLLEKEDETAFIDRVKIIFRQFIGKDHAKYKAIMLETLCHLSPNTLKRLFSDKGLYAKSGYNRDTASDFLLGIQDIEQVAVGKLNLDSLVDNALAAFKSQQKYPTPYPESYILTYQAALISGNIAKAQDAYDTLLNDNEMTPALLRKLISIWVEFSDWSEDTMTHFYRNFNALIRDDVLSQDLTSFSIRAIRNPFSSESKAISAIMQPSDRLLQAMDDVIASFFEFSHETFACLIKDLFQTQQSEISCLMLEKLCTHYQTHYLALNEGARKVDFKQIKQAFADSTFTKTSNFCPLTYRSVRAVGSLFGGRIFKKTLNLRGRSQEVMYCEKHLCSEHAHEGNYLALYVLSSLPYEAKFSAGIEHTDASIDLLSQDYSFSDMLALTHNSAAKNLILSKMAQ